MTRLRVAVVGAGIGVRHLAAWRTLQDLFEIAAVVEVDGTRGEQAARLFEIPHALASFDEMLDLDGLGVVDICTPPEWHLEMIQRGLAAGKHVVCEKPLVTSLADCDALAAANPAATARLMPVFQYRFGAGLQKLKHLADKGVLGRCYSSSVETAWMRGADYYAVDWRGRWATERGGALLSHAIHNHDLLTYIVGPPRRVYAHTATRVNAIETEDCAAISMEMADGSLATSSVTLGSAHEISRLRFCFEALTAESATDPYAPAAEPWTFAPTSPAAAARINAALEDFAPGREDYEGQFERFHQSVTTGAALPVTFADARAAIELVTALYASAQTGEAVEVPLSPDCRWYQNWTPAEYQAGLPA